MWPSLLASIFGGGALGWLSHALYIRPRQLKGAPAGVTNAVLHLENGVVLPVVLGLGQQALNNLANPAAAIPLPTGTAIGAAVTTAALGAITAALTGAHVSAPDPAPIDTTSAPVAAPPAPPALPITRAVVPGAHGAGTALDEARLPSVPVNLPRPMSPAALETVASMQVQQAELQRRIEAQQEAARNSFDVLPPTDAPTNPLIGNPL